MTQKQLRALARKALAEYLEGIRTSTDLAHICVAILTAPQFTNE